MHTHAYVIYIIHHTHTHTYTPITTDKQRTHIHTTTLSEGKKTKKNLCAGNGQVRTDEDDDCCLSYKKKNLKKQVVFASQDTNKIAKKKIEKDNDDRYD